MDRINDAIKHEINGVKIGIVFNRIAISPPNFKVRLFDVGLSRDNFDYAFTHVGREYASTDEDNHYYNGLFDEVMGKVCLLYSSPLNKKGLLQRVISQEWVEDMEIYLRLISNQ